MKLYANIAVRLDFGGKTHTTLGHFIQYKFTLYFILYIQRLETRRELSGSSTSTPRKAKIVVKELWKSNLSDQKETKNHEIREAE